MYAAPCEIGPRETGAIFFELLCLIAGRMRQRFFMVEHRGEIAHIEPSPARFVHL